MLIADDIDMKDHEIKNLADPTTNKSAVSKGWFESNSGTFLRLSGGALQVVNNYVVFTECPKTYKNADSNNCLVRYSQMTTILANYVDTSGQNGMIADLSMGGNEIKNISAPSAETSAVSKKWVEDKISCGRGRRETYSGMTLSDDLDMNNNEIVKLGASQLIILLSQRSG